MHPCPLVKKNKLLLLFHSISFTSNLKGFSERILNILASIKVTKSSLLPTAIEFPSGDHVMLIFSPTNEKKKMKKEIQNYLLMFVVYL